MAARSTRPIIIAIIAGSLIIALGLGIGLGIGLNKSDDDEDVKDKHEDGVKEPKYRSSHASFQHAAVAADAEICSKLSKDVMARKGGNAIDATVVGMFCSGILSPHSTGIGGGSFIIVYHSPTKKWYSFDSRETAPLAAKEDMFADNTTSSTFGGKSIGVPGEVKGLWELHSRLGRLKWADLVQPVVQLCRQGFPLPKAVHNAVEKRIEALENKTGYEMFLGDDLRAKPTGSIIKMPKLATTLETIANDPHSFYNGTLASSVVEDVREWDGIITEQDLIKYKVDISPPTKKELLNNLEVYSTPPPGSGPVLVYILGILEGYNFTSSSVQTEENEVLTYHRIAEAFKFAYARRSELGDRHFVDIDDLIQNLTTSSYAEATRLLIDDSKTRNTSFYHPHFSSTEDAGTTHFSVIDGEGSAVSATGTINHYFGSKVVGSRTGIFFNNEMDDFSTADKTNAFGLAPSPTNFIAPGKRPMSSMSPAIVFDSQAESVRLVTGAAGGSKITTATALNIIEVLWLNMSLPASVDRPRIHHQLRPEYLQYGPGLSGYLKEGLQAKGHKLGKLTGISVVQAIEKLGDEVVAVSDYRKGGIPSGF